MSHRGRRRSACGTARKYSFNESPIFHDGDPVYKHKLNALGILQRVVIGGFVYDAVGVEDRDIGIAPNANAAFGQERRRTLSQSLRRH